MMSSLSLVVLPMLMMLAAATDIAVMRIPNWLTGLTAALFFPMAFLTGMPLAEFGNHVQAGVILFVAGYVLFSLGLFGGGDAKLMAAAGFWFGTTDVTKFLVMTALAGGVLALFYVVWSAVLAMRQSGPEEEQGFRKVLRKISPKLPYGCALAAGAILAYPVTWWAEVAGVAAKTLS